MTTTHDQESVPVATERPDEPPRRSRRSLLRTIGLGGATVVVAGTGALSYRVYDTAALNPGSGPAFDPWSQWRQLPGPLGAVAAAVLAASPHNTQPWSFALGPRSIDVFVDEARGTGAVDPLRREQYVGLGCAVENLVLGAAARGLAPEVTWLPDGAEAGRVAHVELGSAQPQANPLYDAIGRRHTNRGPYTSQAVPAQTLAELVDPTGLDGPTVQWILDPAPKAALSGLLVDAAEALTHDQQQSRDGFVWFRNSQDEIQRHRDGLVLDGQGLSPLVLSIAKLLPASSRTDGDEFWVTQTRTVHTATAAAYGVITSASPDDRRTQLEAGRLLQRVHLSATSRGIALQHMNQITERIDREATTGAAATFAPRFAELLPDGERPLLTFRVGYPVRDARPTPRRSARSVTR
ncbi:Acg family FMN-binding oxidoreductase [Kribbella sp. NPDC055071]